MIQLGGMVAYMDHPIRMRSSDSAVPQSNTPIGSLTLAENGGTRAAAIPAVHLGARVFLGCPKYT
jgi:hypothetical protein